MEFVVFFVSAAIAITGAVAMLLSKNAIHSALFLLLNFGAIAILFLLLRAPFLFAVQLIVYAGAIIVLFLFVVMLLGAERAEDERDKIGWQRLVGIILGAALAAQAIYVLFARRDLVMPQPAGTEDFANPTRIGEILFTDYLIPFEITGIILLAAVVGVVVLSQRMQKKG